METLLEKLTALELQVGETYQQIRDLLTPFWISDTEYRNGDITVHINHGFDEHDWSMGSKTAHANGMTSSYYPALWELLHGTFVTVEEPYHPGYDMEG